ncbi:cytochrome c biogenesis protein CcdA [Elusimicrobiota bacterium]
MNDIAILAGKNFLTAFWIAYAAGVATSFTPCIYPLIPVTIGIIGSNSEKKLKSFILSLIYVAGIAITYMILGIVASVGGQMFGFTAKNPLVNIIIGAVLFVFGLSMLDIIQLPLIGMRGVKHNKYSKSWIGILAMGLASGLVAAPCATPVLGSILAFVAANSWSIPAGGALLLVYGFGCGTLLIIVGTFAGVTAALPKSGKWMVTVKKVFGIIIILSAIYFIYNGVKLW